MILSSNRVKDEFVGELLPLFLKYRILSTNTTDAGFWLTAPSPGGIERRNQSEMEKMTYMRSDGGTQTEDVGRMDQDVWMGYNHVNPAVSLAGRGMCGRSPAFLGAHVSPMWFYTGAL